MRIAGMFVDGLRDLLIHLVQARMLDFDGFKALYTRASLRRHPRH
jgi:hypothetical protein